MGSDSSDLTDNTGTPEGLNQVETFRWRRWIMVTNSLSFGRVFSTDDKQSRSVTAWRLPLPTKAVVLAFAVMGSLAVGDLMLDKFGQGKNVLASVLVLWLVLGVIELLDRSLKVSGANGELWVRDWWSQEFTVVEIDETVAPSWRKRRRITYLRDGRPRSCWIPSRSPLAQEFLPHR